MSLVKIEIRGVQKVKQKLSRTERKIRNSIKQSMGIIGLFMEGQIKQSVSRGTNASVAVDTGRLVNSITSESDNDSATIGDGVTYGKFVEFGTSKMGARPHFRNTLNVNKNNIKNIIKKVIQTNI